MLKPPLDRMLDRLPVNEAYDGVVADAYDTWLPVDEPWPDEIVYRDAFREVEGTILELGCGTGRPLLRWLADGLDIEGLMPRPTCFRSFGATQANVASTQCCITATSHRLRLDHSFGAIVCVAGSFMLIDDETRAREALISYREHLFPGGLLGLSLGAAPPSERDSSFVWKLRRTGTDDAGVTYIVHEAIHTDRHDLVTTVYDRLERTTEAAG